MARVIGKAVLAALETSPAVQVTAWAEGEWYVEGSVGGTAAQFIKAKDCKKNPLPPVDNYDSRS